MTLKEWIKSTGRTQETVAAELGLSRITINRIANGAPPSAATAKNIVALSESAVTYNELYS